MDTEALEDMVARELQGLRTMSGIDGVVPSYIDLPAGRLAMAEYSAPSTGGLEQSVFFLLHDGRGYSLTCTAASRHADRWLTVAQSIEFLPAE